MSEASQLADALLEGKASDFIKNLRDPEPQLLKMGFARFLRRAESIIYYTKYPRPSGMPTPYTWGDMALVVYRSAIAVLSPLYELGLCTMGQLGTDYPDIWLGRYPAYEIIQRTSAAMEVLAELPDDTTYDQLDHLLRTAVNKVKEVRL